jgi:hypothetical protein
MRVAIANMVTRAVLHNPPDETPFIWDPRVAKYISIGVRLRLAYWTLGNLVRSPVFQPLPGKTYHTLIGM